MKQSLNNRSRTKYTVLGMLSSDKFTGYEIIKMIQSSTNYFWSESEGQIYPTLSQCVIDGLATFKEEKSQKIKRNKKVYSITTKGKKELVAWLKKEPQSSLVRNEFLLKLFFGGNLDKEDNLHHVIHRQKQLNAELNTYEKKRQVLIVEYRNHPQLKYWLMTLDYGIKTTKAELSWCKETLKLLK